MSRPDPGGVFASETHRRVLGHLPVPGEPGIATVVADEASHTPRELRRLSLHHRLADDQHTELDGPDDLQDTLSDLEASGYAAQTDTGWVMTDAGLAALQAPVAEEVTDSG